MCTATYALVIVTAVNVAFHKSVHASQPGSNLENVVDGDFNTEAYLGNDSMPFIAVDLGNHYVIEKVYILLRAGGKRIPHFSRVRFFQIEMLFICCGILTTNISCIPLIGYICACNSCV